MILAALLCVFASVSTATAAESNSQTSSLSPALPALAPPAARPAAPPLAGPAEEEEGPLLPHSLRHAKWAALIDGGWSAALYGGWILSGGLYEAPYLEGAAGFLFTRVLYGTTWSVLISAGVWLLHRFSGDNWEGLRYGQLRNDWALGFDIPGGCKDVKSHSCGLGLGGFNELSVRLKTKSLPIELLMLGGWIQGHHDRSARRTLMESTWIQAPFIARAHLPFEAGPLRIEVALGAGAYYGLHAAHLHARPGHQDEVDAPLLEMLVLHGGLGPGVHAKLWITLFDTLTIEGDADLAPLLLGGSFAHANPELAALDPYRSTGPVFWRRVSAGLGLSRAVLDPVRVALRMYGAELSPGPVTRLGHKAFMFQFEVPFDLEDEEDQDAGDAASSD